MHRVKKISALILALMLALSLAACGEAENGDIWVDAEYTEDTELGTGANTVTVEVTAGEKTVVLTLHTDAEFLGGALEENGLVTGEEGDFGLYIKSVNGIVADYDTDGYYWALYVDGEYATTGVDTTPVTDGGSYSLVREAA